MVRPDRMDVWLSGERRCHLDFQATAVAPISTESHEFLCDDASSLPIWTPLCMLALSTTYVALGPVSPGRAACDDPALEGIMRRPALWVVLVLGVMAGSAEASAILIVDSNGILQGATGVTVDGALYDVELIHGSCPELFSGCDAASDFPFQTSGAATLAAQALRDQVLLDGPQGPFDSSPEMNSGCWPFWQSPEPVCEIFVPFQLAPFSRPTLTLR